MSELTNTEIDRKCAEIMGWREVLGYRADDDDYVIATEKWHPSLDLNQAWQVVEKRIQTGWRLELIGVPMGYGVYLSEINSDKREEIRVRNELPLPRAICLACIQAWEGRK